MTPKFKKDYINYILYSLQKEESVRKFNNKLRNLLATIIASDDLMKIAFIIGKTESLETLFKYILYISDKIDKSQVTVFNLKDNFEHDKQNLLRICEKIEVYLLNRKDKIDFSRITNGEESGFELGKQPKDTIKIETTIADSIAERIVPEVSEVDETIDEDSVGMSLIENNEANRVSEEVFELDEITQTVQRNDEELDIETGSDNIQPLDIQPLDEVAETPEEFDEVSSNTEEIKITDKAEIAVKQTESDDNIMPDKLPGEIEDENVIEEEKTEEEIVETAKLPELEFEIKSGYESEEVSVSNEAYYKFETKFFEDVKILEKLFSNIGKEYAGETLEKLDEKTLQCLTQIIEIATELGNLSRQLQLDLTADIFLTINIYFTKAIAYPTIITGERLKLMDASLSLVNSLIKGEDYLDYNLIVDKIEQLKEDMQRPIETKLPSIEPIQEITHEADFAEKNSHKDSINPKSYVIDEVENKQVSKSADMDTVNFKLRYLVKEFEKNFGAIQNLEGEYGKYEALDSIDLLNNSLRIIAKISATAKIIEVCKLAEVSYVFLKYCKDYRIDILDQEIIQIIKYIIFTFKMLLTGRYPDDLIKLVQYLNDPVKIFTDQ